MQNFHNLSESEELSSREEQYESKGASRKRPLPHSESEQEEEDTYNSSDNESDKELTHLHNQDTEASDSEFDINKTDDEFEESIKNTIGKPLCIEELQKFTSDVNKTGVVYISHVPPFMKPIKLRHLLSQYGEIGRIYLAPEDAKIAARRKKYKGNKRKNYTEGWIEFMDKKVARKLAETLNAQPIGGKKRNYYYDDLWALKYLPRFRWTNLTEQIAYERAVKEQRMRAEMSEARKKNKEYIKNVDKAKMIESMEQRKEVRNEEAPSKTKHQRTIRQRKSVLSEQNRVTVDTKQASALSRLFA